MTFSPYFYFNGNTKEAIYFYRDAFKTEEPDIMYYKDMPPSDEFPITEENKNLVMHASLKIRDTLFMFSDSAPGRDAKFGDNLTIMYDSKDADELTNLFEFFRDGGKIIRELEETFWSGAYGSLEDKFGVTWQFNLDDE